MKLATLMAIMILTMATAVFAAQMPVTLERVEIDDNELSANAVNRLDIERGKQVEVEVRLSSSQNLKDVEIEALIAGFEFNDVERISDVTPVFDMDANVSYVKRLQLVIPDDVDEDNYKLRVIVTNRDDDTLTQNFGLKIDVPRHAIGVEDVILSPGSTVKAGSSLLASVRLENKGEKDEEDVKVTFSIPDLGVSATDYIDEIENGDEEEETEELFLRLPRCAKPGTYAARVEVQFNDERRKFTETRQVTVLENEQCSEDGQPELTVSVGSNLESVGQGGAVVFPLTLINTGRTSRSFTITPSAVSFATARVTPTSTAIIDAGRTQTVYVSVQTNANAPAGTNPLSVQVLSNGKTLAEIPLSVNVVAQSGMSLRKVLEVGMLGLLVLLVLIGLVIGLSKMRSEEEPQDKPEQKAYY